jgi:hypothetical protein
MTEAAEIEKAALQLPIGQRVWLAQSLLDSLALPSADVPEEAEIEEAERREREIETGQVQTMSDAELWRQVEARRQA